MQRVRVIYCFICKVSVLFTALYAKCPYYVVLCMQERPAAPPPAVPEEAPLSPEDFKKDLLEKGIR